MSWDGFLNNHVSKGVLTTCGAHSCCALHDLSVTGFFITAASATGNAHQGHCRKCVGPILESLQILLAVCTSCLNVYYCVLRASYTWQTSTSKRNSWSVQHVRQVWIFEAKVYPSTRKRLPLKPKRKGPVHELQACHVAALDLVMRGAQSEKHCSFFGKHFRFIAVSLTWKAQTWDILDLLKWCVTKSRASRLRRFCNSGTYCAAEAPSSRCSLATTDGCWWQWDLQLP